jgi:hypothetical protein
MQIALKKWAVTIHPVDHWIAPESRGNPSLGGIPDTGPLAAAEKKKIVTSPIASVKGRVVTTRSGSVYRLTGRPDPFFLGFLRDRGLAYDGKDPLRALIAGKYIHLGPQGISERAS